MVLRGAGGGAEHGAFPARRDPDRHDGRHRDHPAGLTDLVEGGIQPHVRTR